jgi:hypothetical protein
MNEANGPPFGTGIRDETDDLRAIDEVRCRLNAIEVNAIGAQAGRLDPGEALEGIIALAAVALTHLPESA